LTKRGSERKYPRMKVTLAQIINSETALQKLLTSELPVKASFLPKGLVRQTAEQMSTFNLERTKLIEKHGTPDPDKAGFFTFQPDQAEAFNQEIKPLTDVEITLNFEPISVELLGDGVKMTPVEMSALDPFLTA
jgi:hypothetical protein